MSILTESGRNMPGPWRKDWSYSVIAAAVITVFLSCLMAHADGQLGRINIRLAGTVVALGCTVDPGDVDKPVYLGEWTTRQLKKSGQTTSPVPFIIHLTGCSASSVTTTFTGTKDKTNPDFLALKSDVDDYATGIAVQIMDASGQRIPLGNAALRDVVDGNGNVTLNFRANYVSTGNDGVRPGTADADAEFMLSYD